MRGRGFKRDVQLILISVIILTITTIRVSYSYVFSVKSQTTIQKITAGDLEVTINGSSALSGDELYPIDEDELPTSSNSTISSNYSYATLVLNNTGNLDADYSVSLEYDDLPNGVSSSDLLSMQYMVIGIYDVTNNAWVNFGTAQNTKYWTLVTNLTPTNQNVYPIIRNIVQASASRSYRIYVWLEEGTPVSEIGKYVYLKLEVKSATVNGRIEE